MASRAEPIHPESLAAHSAIVEEKVFFRYQLDVINDEHIAQLVEKGRQEGLSWAMAYKAQKWTGQQGRYPTFFATKTRILAKQFIQDCAAWAKLSRLIKSTVDATYEDEVKVFNSSTEEEEQVHTYNVRFANKLEVTALSSNADAMRGWRGFKVADEFALHKQQAEMLDAILPSRQWRFPFSFISTHKGINSEFNKMIKKFRQGLYGPDWNLISIPIQRAVADGLLEKIFNRPFTETERQEWLANLEREEGQRRWKQEYCCIPEDEEGSFFSYDLIITCEDEETLYYPEDGIKKFSGQGQEQEALAWFEKTAFAARTLGTGRFYLGMDIGRDINYTVLALIEEMAGIRFVRALAALENMRFQVQQDCAKSWIRLPRFVRGCVDNRGMGRETGERLQEEFGPFVIERIDFSLKLKETIVYAVHRLMSDRMLKLPPDDTVRDDIHSIRKEVTDAGNTRYVAGQNESDPNSHGDYYTGISLAVHAADGSAPSMDTLIEAAAQTAGTMNDLLRGIGNVGSTIFDQFRQFLQP